LPPYAVWLAPFELTGAETIVADPQRVRNKGFIARLLKAAGVGEIHLGWRVLLDAGPACGRL